MEDKDAIGVPENNAGDKDSIGILAGPLLTSPWSAKAGIKR